MLVDVDIDIESFHNDLCYFMASDVLLGDKCINLSWIFFVNRWVDPVEAMVEMEEVYT